MLITSITAIKCASGIRMHSWKFVDKSSFTKSNTITNGKPAWGGFREERGIIRRAIVGGSELSAPASTVCFGGHRWPGKCDQAGYFCARHSNLLWL